MELTREACPLDFLVNFLVDPRLLGNVRGDLQYKDCVYSLGFSTCKIFYSSAGTELNCSNERH